MSSFSLRLPVGTSDLFNDLPNSVKHFLRNALNIFTRLYGQHPQVIVSVVLDSVASGSEPKATDLSARFGLSEDDGQAMVGAISFLMLILSKPGRLFRPS